MEQWRKKWVQVQEFSYSKTRVTIASTGAREASLVGFFECSARARLRGAFGSLSSVKITKQKFALTLIAVYLAAVIICILKAFNFEGSINTDWTIAVILLTLPWSLVSILFAWALIHGAGLNFFASMYVVFALINSAIFYRVFVRFKKPEDDEYLHGPGTS